MLRRKDDEKPERGVSLWLERPENRTPYERYSNLPPYYEVVLRNLVCIPTRPTTHSDRKELYKKLCLPVAGKDFDPDDFVPPDEVLRKRFSPVDPSEALTYGAKF